MNWTCPYCNRPTTLTSPNYEVFWRRIDIAASRFDDKKDKGIYYLAITCPNQSCKKLSLETRLTKVKMENIYNKTQGGDVREWQLLPESNAKPQPAYIPKTIVQDYTEACRIKNLSPKAAATLARRCLQGAIRDFWGIKKTSLKREIDDLEDKVSVAEWEAIDAVRSVGNIGAHMEKDVNVIVDVGPDEAELLIQLIEDLFKDWYVARHDRQERHSKLKQLAEAKQRAKKEQKK